jgi:hypothetical protein
MGFVPDRVVETEFYPALRMRKQDFLTLSAPCLSDSGDEGEPYALQAR